MSEAAWPLIGLFTLAFSAATLLPSGSEVALLSMAAMSTYSILTLLIVASIGNTLGSVLNYALGRFALHYQDRKWFPVSQNDMTKAQGWFAHWGQWSILLAWVPIVGDPLTFAAGMMRMNFWRFLILVAVSKTARYMVILGIFNLLA